ncbi:MAG TPA: hypothetical protein VN364_12205 [Bellilinea sp.]|nr:hypothetical protein [Bellilinea sp.]
MVRKRIFSVFQYIQSHAEAFTYIPIYFFISFTSLVLKLRHAPAWQSGFGEDHGF